MKPTQIRVTNLSKEEVEIDFKDIINGVDLSLGGIRYELDGDSDEREDNRLKEACHLRMSSVDVVKSINKMIYPKIDLKDFRKRNWKNLIDIKINIKVEQVKLIINPKYHIILSFYYDK